MGYWTGKRVLVTGGSGFVGRHLCEALADAGAARWAPTRQEINWLLPRKNIPLVMSLHFDVLFHLAAQVGGIQANMANPASFFRDNMLMGLNVLDACVEARVEKLVMVGTCCAYPANLEPPFREDLLWNGYPEPTNAPYGVAKRALHTACVAYRQQYGLNAIYLIPANLYGPGDSFDPAKSHVIPALIRKFVEARIADQPEVEIWGDGSATREFLYVGDCARGLMQAAEMYNSPDPVNLGTRHEVAIAYLAQRIAEAAGYHGTMRFERGKPSGQRRRLLDIDKALREFGFLYRVQLGEGIKRTVEWYEENRDAIQAQDTRAEGESAPAA